VEAHSIPGAGDAAKDPAATQLAGHVVVVGSLNMDLVVRAARLPLPGETLSGSSFMTVPGGKGGNQAVAAARLGARVAMIGRVGADAYGEQLKQGLEAEGIDCSGVDISTGTPTGIAMIVVDDTSQNAIVVVPGSNGELSAADLERHAAVLAVADVVLCQLEVPHATIKIALEMAQRLGKRVLLNPAPVCGPLPPEWLAAADYLIPNELEAAALTGMPASTVDDAILAAQALRLSGARNVIITLGARGIVSVTDDGVVHYPADKVDAIDTTAAGDTFLGGLAAAMSWGWALPEAIHFGQAAASLSVTRAGAQPSIPYLNEVRS